MSDARESAELLPFRNAMVRKGVREWKLKETQIQMSMDLLCAILEKLYSGSVPSLVQQAQNAGEALRFSAAINEAATSFQWSSATLSKYFGILKRILNETSVEESFTKRLKLESSHAPYNKILGRKNGSCDSDPVTKALLEGWISKLKSETRNNSELSLRNMMSFYTSQCIPKFGISLEKWPADCKIKIQKKFKDQPNLFEEICGPPGTHLSFKKATWLNVFLNDVLEAEILIPRQLLKRQTANATDQGDGSDVHRISSTDLQKIYEQCKGSIGDELMFLLMITTGMRVGGLVNICISDVTDTVDAKYVTRTQGRTKEKGGKWLRFLLTEQVQHLISEWLTNHRPANKSPYLFPGPNEDHIATETVRSHFKRLCINAGLEGEQFHPHALRHTFAHMLLETGNPIEVISKCMNHSSCAITESFYLKENPHETLQRANIPWMKRKEAADKPATLPSFLDVSNSSRENQSEHASKRHKASASMSALGMFMPL